MRGNSFIGVICIGYIILFFRIDEFCDIMIIIVFKRNSFGVFIIIESNFLYIIETSRITISIIIYYFNRIIMKIFYFCKSIIFICIINISSKCICYLRKKIITIIAKIKFIFINILYLRKFQWTIKIFFFSRIIMYFKESSRIYKIWFYSEIIIIGIWAIFEKTKDSKFSIIIEYISIIFFD